MQSEEIQSKVINFLRFPCMLGVVFLHNPVPFHFPAEGVFQDIVYTLFSNIIPAISVPFFFFISGYFFFNKSRFDTSVYLEKIGRRARTLLLPYVIWTTAWLVTYYLLYKSPLAGGFLGKGREYTFRYIIEAYWCSQVPDAVCPAPGNPTILPEIGQFWYLRDLMFVLLLGPVIYHFIKRIGIWFVAILGAAWLVGLRIPYLGERGLSFLALFFVSAGAWFAIGQKNFLAEFLRLRHLVFVFHPLVVTAALLLSLHGQASEIFQIVLRISILSGLPFFVNLAAVLFEKRYFQETPFLASAGFLIFVLHQPWLFLAFQKFFLKNQMVLSSGNGLFYYCLFPALVVVICLPLNYFLRRFFPTLNNLLTGGR